MKPYVARTDRDSHHRSAIAIAKALLTVAEDVRMPALRKALSAAVWEYTESDGKFTCRYRSEGALASSDAREIRHEHVVPRAVLVTRMLAEPDRVEQILESSIACLVTVSEHTRLNRVDPALQGWDRYVAAEVAVWDGQAEEWLIAPHVERLRTRED